MVFSACAAAIICMIRPFGPLESSGCAQPSSILFSLYPLTGNSLSLVPLGCLILVWAACAQNFSRSAQGLWVTEATVRGQAISEVSGLLISFPIRVTSVSAHQKSGSDDFILIRYYVTTFTLKTIHTSNDAENNNHIASL